MATIYERFSVAARDGAIPCNVVHKDKFVELYRAALDLERERDDAVNLVREARLNELEEQRKRAGAAEQQIKFLNDRIVAAVRVLDIVLPKAPDALTWDVLRVCVQNARVELATAVNGVTS